MRGNDKCVPRYLGYIEGMLFITLSNLYGLVMICREIIFCICEFKFRDYQG
ncbi:Uncharacterised protein [Photobacterium damselae]|nr:Uncharacterised protein [Photobacterium damselae]